jgi:hypothetical protein
MDRLEDLIERCQHRAALVDQRQELRAAYAAVHGTDSDRWPNRHPGIVIDTVQWVALPACLGCQWIEHSCRLVGISCGRTYLTNPSMALYERRSLPHVSWLFDNRREWLMWVSRHV